MLSYAEAEKPNCYKKTPLKTDCRIICSKCSSNDFQNSAWVLFSKNVKIFVHLAINFAFALQGKLSLAKSFLEEMNNFVVVL